jgi:Lrp/AsnC family leucine-responsive transcriptional regulator
MLRMKMKKLDKEILLQLIEDSQQPVYQIAKKVGTTRQTVTKKIARFKETGLIQSFTPKLNPEKLGLTTRAYVFLREDPRTELRKKDEDAIRRFREVFGFYRLFGRYSAILEIMVRSSEELTSLIKKIHGLKGVRETETFIVHSTVKDVPEGPFVRVLMSEG